MIPIAVVVVAIGAFVVFKSGDSGTPAAVGQPVDQSKLVRTTSHMTGSPSAKVTLVEFGDYQCPSCGAAYQPIKDLVSQYSSNSNFNFVFREFPLSSVHPNADIAAEAAEAAGEQGAYWQMHDLLYQNQAEWADSGAPMQFFLKYAQQIGLDVNKFQTEVQASKFDSVISADVADGNAVNVNATPTFYVNGVPYVGDQGTAISDAIAKDLAALPAAPTATPTPSKPTATK
jgi:protein-disulfide isomerase